MTERKWIKHTNTHTLQWPGHIVWINEVLRCDSEEFSCSCCRLKSLPHEVSESNICVCVGVCYWWGKGQGENRRDIQRVERGWVAARRHEWAASEWHIQKGREVVGWLIGRYICVYLCTCVRLCHTDGVFTCVSIRLVNNETTRQRMWERRWARGGRHQTETQTHSDVCVREIQIDGTKRDGLLQTIRRVRLIFLLSSINGSLWWLAQQSTDVSCVYINMPSCVCVCVQ